MRTHCPICKSLHHEQEQECAVEAKALLHHEMCEKLLHEVILPSRKRQMQIQGKLDRHRSEEHAFAAAS